MKKKLWMTLLSVVALFALAIGITACKNEPTEPKQLDTPVVTISDEGEASWTADPNAIGYVYIIDNGSETPTDDTSVQLTDGQAISVQALGDGVNYTNSEFSTPKPYTATKPEHTEHTYGEPKWEWTGTDKDGYTAAKAVFTCVNNDDTQTVSATNVSSSKEKQESCTEDGEMLYTASVTFNGEPYSDEKHVTINRLGHDLQSVARQDATCEDAGYTAHQACSRCEYKEGYTPLLALGHNYGDPTWEWTGNDSDGYTAAEATFTCSRNSTHVERRSANATTETNVARGCDTCTVYTVTVTFEEKDYSAHKDVPDGNSNHDLGAWHREEAATCVTKGTMGYYQCSKCEYYFDIDENYITDDAADLIIDEDQNNHTDIIEIAATATCEKSGFKTHWQCDDCKALFSDSEGKNPISEPEVQNPLGHNYVRDEKGPNQYPSKDGIGSWDVTCSRENCDGEKTKTVDLPKLTDENYKVEGTVTCTQGGELTYTITIDDIKFEFTIQTEALGHDLAWTSNATEHWQYCKRDCGHTESRGEHSGWSYTKTDNATHSKSTTCSEHDAFTVETENHTFVNGVCTGCEHTHEHGDDLKVTSGETNHTISCDKCGYKDEGAHSYENGFCVCGKADSTHTEIVTYDPSAKYTEDKSLEGDVAGVISFTYDKGNNKNNAPKYFENGKALRAYGGNTITLTVEGFTIVQIKFTFGTGGDSNEITANKGTFATDTWTGVSDTVTFTIAGTTGNRRISKIEITVVAPKAVSEYRHWNPPYEPTNYCTEEGTEEYWTCDICGKMFSDQHITVITEPEVIPAKGHDFGGKATQTSTTHHSGICTICRLEVSAEHNKDGDNGTCDQCGYDPNAVDPEQKVKDAIDGLVIPGTLEEDYKLTVPDGITFHVTENDNEAVITFDEDTQTLKVTPGATEVTVHITVTANFGDATSTPREYTIIVPKAKPVWKLVESTSQLYDGAPVVLVYDGAVNGGISGTNKYMDYVSGVEVSEDKKTIKSMPDGHQKLTLGKSGSDSNATYTFSIGNTAIGLTGTSNNSMSLTSATRTTTWKISISEGVAQITSTLSNTCRLQCNTASNQTRFSNYATATQKDPSIYILSDGSTGGGDSGNTGTTHTCTSTCTQCGKCTNMNCQEDACKPKCDGHNQGGGENPTPTKFYTLTATGGKNSSYTGNEDVDVNGITWNVEANLTLSSWGFGGKSITNTNRSVTSQAPLAKKVTKVVIKFGTSNITVNSVTLKVSKTAPTNKNNLTANYTAEVKFTASGSFTIEVPENEDWSNCYYQLTFNVTNSTSSNKNVQLSEMEFWGY